MALMSFRFMLPIIYTKNIKSRTSTKHVKTLQKKCKITLHFLFFLYIICLKIAIIRFVKGGNNNEICIFIFRRK